MNALNLQACILGGGLAVAGEALRDRVAAVLPEFCWPYLLARTELRLAALSAEAGMVGAAAYARAAQARAAEPSR